MSVKYPSRSAANSTELITEFTYDEPTPIAIAIVQALAEIKDIDPLEIDITLFDHVPPDTLDMIIGHDNASGPIEITFPVENHLISVLNTGTVRIYEHNDRTR